MPYDKIDELYYALQKDGAVSKSRENFRSKMLAPGKEGYKNRKQLYDALKADGAVESSTYEEFGKKLGLHAVQGTTPKEKPVEHVTTSQPEVTASVDKAKKRWQPTEQDKIRMSMQTQKIVSSSKRSMDDLNERMDNMQEYGLNLGSSTKTGKKVFNSESGQMEDTYITPVGNRYNNKPVADRESFRYREAADMTVGGMLRKARERREDIASRLAERGKQLNEQESSWADMPRGSGGAVHTYNSATNNGRMTDGEYAKLNTALRQVDQQIATLTDEQDRNNGQDVGFWRGFGSTIGDMRTWDYGMGDIMDATSMLTHDTNLTEKEKEASGLMMNEIANKQQVDERYGDNSFWNRAGVMTGYMPSFMLDFILTRGGFSGIKVLGKAGLKMATKVIGKDVIEDITKQGFKSFVKNNGVKGLGQAATNWTIKALGTTADDLLLRAPLMTNTIQLGKTTADIIERKLGDVVVDDSGEYNFSDDKTWGGAMWQGEANSIIENYSEMFGAHLDPVMSLSNIGKLANTIGAKRLGGVFAKADAGALNGIMGTTHKMFNKMGVSDLVGEGTEEYYGQLWRTMLNLDDAYQQNADGSRTNLFNTGRFHGDIWGGMALSMGLMGAGKHTINAANYVSMKHGVNKADKSASEILGVATWEPMKEIIDLTTNESIGDVADLIVNNGDFTEDEKSAVLNYMERSLNLRGFNLGSIAQSRGGEKSDNEQQANESYLDGYNATSSQEMNDAKNMVDYQREQMKRIVGTNDEALEGDVIDWLNEAQTSDAGSARQQTILDYINAKQVYDGVMARVRDDIDGRIDQSNAMISAHTNHDSGRIQGATMKQDDRKVYVVSGNLVRYTDNTGIDLAESDESIIIRDAETGALEQVSPDAVLSIDDEQDPYEQQEIAAQAIREQFAQEAADKIDGTVSLNLADTYTITGEDGNQMQVQIVANKDGNFDNGDGTVNVSSNGSDIFPLAKEVIQQSVDASNISRVSEFEKQRVEENFANQQSVSEASRAQYALNDTVTLRDESGNSVRGSITADADADADGRYEVFTEDAINGKRVNLFTRDELDGMLSEHNGEVIEQSPVIETAESVPETAESVETEQPQVSATERIPKDEKGQPIYEKAETPDIAWDAIVERTEGDEVMAQTVADGMVADKEAALKKIVKAKSKGGATIAEKIDAEKERNVAIKEATAQLEIWKRISQTSQSRKVAEQSELSRIASEKVAELKAEQEKLRIEQEESERIEREALNGVPDMVDDTPQDARARGYRRVSGHKVDRQEPIQSLQGKEVSVKFGNDAISNGRVTVIEAEELQPSHLQGERNHAHFIDEAQPKERNDEASVLSARKIASDIRPEEITSSVTAYTGAPTVNARGEVIQGNSRSDALREMWNSNNEQSAKYKEYLKAHADEFGLSASDIDGMKRPVLVNMLKVSDEEAIQLGQYVAQDTESGGIERIKPKNALQRMGADIRSFSNLLLKSADNETSFAGLVDNNGVEVLKWMNRKGYITPTQYRSAFDTKDNLTAEVKNDLKGILYQSIFKGGSTRLEEMFNAMPAKAQRAILATAYRDYDSPNAERMVDEIQNSLRAYNALSTNAQFSDAKTFKEARLAVESWKRQYQMDDVSGESYLPAENFSNFALHLATMYKGENQSFIQSTFNQLYDLIQGVQEKNLFEQPNKTPRTLAQAIYETLKIEYDGQQRSNVLVGDTSTSQQREQGSNGSLAPGERVEDGNESADRTGGTERGSGQSEITSNTKDDAKQGAETTIERTDDSGVEATTDNSGRVADDTTEETPRISNRGDIRVFEEGLGTRHSEHSEYSERNRRQAESERLVAIAKQNGQFISESETKPFSEYKIAKSDNGETKLSDQEEDLFQKAERISKGEEKPKNEGVLGLVSDKRMTELKERLRKKLGGQLNVGLDPEILAIGMELAAGHIDRGVKKFADFAKVMVDDLGDVIRPYIKAFYNGVRDLPEIIDNGLSAELTPYDEVRVFDIEREENTQKRNKSKKNNVSSQQKSTDLFSEILIENKKEDGLQGNDGVRSKGLSADNNRRSTGRGGENDIEEIRKESGRTERGGESRVERISQGIQPSNGRPTGRLQGLNTNNNHSDRGQDHAPISIDARIEANIKAIELSQRLIGSGEKATPQQMSLLRKFSGWGGLGKAFSVNAPWHTLPDGRNSNENETRQRLQELLGLEAYQQAVMSANSAYYTPSYVVDTLWDIAKQMGFDGGNVLEGSAGIGNVLGQMPTDVSERSNIQAIEIDGTSGGILSLLYPDAKVDIQGFEQTRIPNGSIDLAITNVPFVTGLRVNDTTGDSDLSKKFHNIHDFCISKNIRKLRDGGIGIFITSNGTLDNSKKLRDWIVSDGCSDFVGAFRMNNKTFGGTGVTSDIIVVRKRVNGKKSTNAIDVIDISGERSAEYSTGETRKVKGQDVPIVKQLSMDYNKYFIEHPENMAGEMHFAFEQGDTFRPTSKGLYPTKGKNQEQMLSDFVNSFKEDEFSDKGNNTNRDVSEVMPDKKIGEMFIRDGKLCVNSTASAQLLTVNDNKVKGHTKVECFNAYFTIKQALKEVLSYQTNNESDNGLEPLLFNLNKAYDSFVETYGHFNKNTSISFLRNDVDYPNVFSLETLDVTLDENGKRVHSFGKTDVFKRRVVENEKEPTPTNVNDGIVASVFKFGRIDVPYIAQQIGKSEQEVKSKIISDKLGFEDPTTKQMELSFQYLSGNIREKLRQAQDNNDNGYYNSNIKSLQDVIPMDIPAHLIDFTLGSSWIDPKLYNEYTKERTDIDVKFTSIGGTWFMSAPEYGLNKEKNRSIGVSSEQFHKQIMGHTLIEAAIQNKSISVSETRKKYDGTTETITDKEATQACATKIDEIRQDFKEWARQKMQSDSEISAQMERIYNDTFNNYVPLSIPDEYAPKYFGGASHKFKMYQHQSKAIVRGTMQSLLLSHEVGTGKTFTLISTAMEMRRLGTARKPMIVVQNATVGQFVASAKELYPNAKILTLEDSDRTAEGRKNFYAKIRYNDWDMIVVPQSTFEFIPDSEERQMAFVQDKIEEKMIVLEKMEEADPHGNDIITRQAAKEIADLEVQLASISDDASKKRTASEEKKQAVTKQNAEVQAIEMLDRRTDDVENFDEMGIDALLIDEAHEYKHLGFATAMQRGVKGVDSSYSKKSQGVYLKTQSIIEKNNGRNVIFATGTPISNTAAEIWTFMRYLMPSDTMKGYGIYYFDDFVRNFGNIQQMMEFTASGKFKEQNRFAGYVNLPELIRIWSGVSDTVLTKEAEGVNNKIPEIEGGKAQDLYLPQTKALRGIMKYVKAQLEAYEKMSGKAKKENSHIPLVMYGLAKAAAVDARLVDADAEDDKNSKTNESVRQTLRTLQETSKYKGTVAIFADNYQNKHSGFNLYEDIREKLIAEGIPADEVVVIKSGMSVKKKLDIFDKVNNGEIRVVMGSTFTLGTGVNIQERLHTVIHLDAPNRPMDYTQRNGRILRQGNLHKSMGKAVRVLRFGVEDSLDVTAYQRLKTKGAIADSIMNGKHMMQNSMVNRVLEEEEDVFGDTVAQLSGSEYAMLKNNAEKNVRKYESRKKQWEADQTYIYNAKPKLKGQIATAEKRAEEQRKYLQELEKAFADEKSKELIVGKQSFATVDDMTDFVKDYNKKILDSVKEMKDSGSNGEQKRELIVSVGGYDFNVKTVMSKEIARGGGQLFSEIHRIMTYSCSKLGLVDVPVRQALLRNALVDITENVITGKDFAERAESSERSVKYNQSELEQVLSRDGKPFEYDKELEQSKKQYIEYAELMKKEMEDKEAKYSEMDNSVEVSKELDSLEDDDDVLMREDEGLAEVNERFNEELQEQIEGTLPNGHVYQLGNASEFLQEAGIPNLPIELPASQLESKSTSGKHDFHLSEVENLPNALANPIATFAYGDKGKSQNILTILEHDGENFLVGLFIRPKINGRVLEVNSVRNVFPKNDESIVRWILDRKLTNANKKKLLNFLDQQRTNYADVASVLPEEQVKQGNAKASEVESLKSRTIPLTLATDLNSATKIVNEFENSTLSGANSYRKSKDLTDEKSINPRELRKQMSERVNELADKLSLDNVEIVSDASKLDGKKRKAKGFYTKSTGKITIIIGNHTSIADVEKTLLHEAVAHYGLRKMFGAHFETFLDNVFNNADESVRRKIVELSIKNGWDFRKATEEYLAGLAESTNFEGAKKSGWWNKVKSLFCELLQELGFADYNDVITDNELRYVLWRSYENMKENKYSGLLSEATDVAKQYELCVGEFADFYSNRKASVRERENTQLSAHRLDTDALSDANIVNDSEIQATDDENLLYRASSPRSEAQDIYEKATTRSFLHNLSEGWYDHLRSVQALQESLEKELGRNVEDFENVYQNAMFKSSVDMKEIESMQKLVESLMDTVVSITSEKGISQKDVERYMNCKHGVEERNEKFAKRDTERAKKARISELDKLLNNGDIDQAKYDERVKEADKKSKKDYANNRKRDYSGLTAIFDPERTGMSNSELESEAKYYVKDFEESVATYKIDALWKCVKELTHFTLTKAYNSGNISKEQYAETSNQFEYYVPLRGFSEDTADDVYDYVTREVNPTQKTLKEAKGRSSEAGNILATMMNMGHSSIVQGNKNKVKQKLLNLALNATNPLLSVTRTWYDKSTDEMLKPNITTNMTADEQREEVERFDEEMLQREKGGEVERHRGSFDIGKRAEKWQADEHCVRVMRNGEEYQIWINGNPKAAQAINGILNPDAGNISLIERTGNTINRFVARNVTSLSINFIVSNFQRDVISSNLVGFAKYGFKYQTQFNRNVKNNLSFLNVKGDKAFRSDSIYSLYHRYNKGTLDMSNERDNYFSEFLKNGGETGYSQMRTIDDYEKVIAKSLRKGTARGKAEKAWAAIGTTIEFANKGIENSCRFAAYMTGRQNGMSVLQSIDDAKECSVNFNRKGSGAMGNKFAKAMYMFLNPAIQGVMQYIMLTKKYPKRMLPLMGGWAALGFVMPMIAQAIIGAMMGGEDGDDDDDYYNLSAWTRRNNLIIPIGKNNYAKIALPPEIRAMYGLGEIAYGMYAGGDKYENKFAATTSQLSQLLPLDVVDANGIVRYDESIWKGVVRGITPSWASPNIDANWWNEDFIGRPITGHTKYDTGVEPEYTKVSNGTLQFLIDASHWINDHTGGTDYTKGKVDGVLGSMFNPSAIEYQFNAYLGGRSQIVGQMWKTIGALFGNEEYQEVRNYPIVNKLVANTDNDYAMYMQSNEGWQYYKTEKEVTDAIMKGLQLDTKKGVFEKAKDIAEYAKTPEYKRSETIKAYQKYINKCYDKAKYEKEDSEKKRLIKEAQELKKKCVEKLEE